jgi:hypothetical protein
MSLLITKNLYRVRYSNYRSTSDGNNICEQYRWVAARSIDEVLATLRQKQAVDIISVSAEGEVLMYA